MPRGGRRAGAGRPPKAGRSSSTVVGFPGVPVPPPSSPDAGDVASLLEPPADLPPAITAPGFTLTSQAEFWRRYAPQAIAQRTLVPSAVPGFRELCELAAFKEELAARLQRYGSEGKAGAERVRNYTRLSQRVDAALARFKLTAFGRAAAEGAKTPTANPWADVAGRRTP